MSKNYDEKIAELNKNLEELTAKAADFCGDAKAAAELGQEVVQDKIRDAKGDLVAAQERIRVAGEKGQNRLASNLIKAQMKLEAGFEDFKTEYDRKKLEKYIDNHLDYLTDLYETISVLLADAELTTMETVEAMDTYKEKYAEEDDGETEE